MTGPDIYRLRHNSNAIGDFIIGVSPIGTIPPFDYWTTVISQYANSPILTQLIDYFFQAADQTGNFDNFYGQVWDVDTAEGWGLDVWGRIVGVSRVVQEPTGDIFFGFEESGDAASFNEAGYGNGFYPGGPLTVGTSLSDDVFRRLILTKAMANISDGSIPSINQMLLNFFPARGNCYVVDDGDMTMQYAFTFAITQTETAIVLSAGVFPKPAGVSASIVQV